jgi:CDP-glucose 4,6-dehydratase
MMNREFYGGKVVLVTGSTGLVGGWLVKALLGQGAKVVALIRDPATAAGSMLFRDGLESSIVTVCGSVEEYDVLCRALSRYSVETVFHLGAQTQVGTAHKDPRGVLEANVRGTWNLLEACRNLPVAQVVIASSVNAYGHSEHLPYDESNPLLGKFPYDCSKSCTDIVSTMYAFSYKLPLVIARCTNIFGGGDRNLKRLIPDVIRTTWQGQRYVIRSDGRFIRDYLYVLDAVDAYLCLGEQLASTPSLSGHAFNFGLEAKCSVLEIVQNLLTIMNRSDLEPIMENRASGEIREQYVRCDKARSVLGWKPRHSLEDGLRKTVAWYTAVLENDQRELKLSTGAAS